MSHLRLDQFIRVSYSSRSATIGSTPAALEAGKYPAAAATASNTSETHTKTAGSVGVVS
jgi:hypothetical protein